MVRPVEKTFSFEGGIFYKNTKFYHITGVLYQEWLNITGYIVFFSLHRDDQIAPTILKIKGELSVGNKGFWILTLSASTIEKSVLIKIKEIYEYNLKELEPKDSLNFKGTIKCNSEEREGHSIEIQLKEEKL